MRIPPTAFPIVVLAAALVPSLPAAALTSVAVNPMSANGGVMRISSFWIDPSEENDSDSDSQAWAPFTLTQAAEVVRVRWWGEAAPSLGFTVAFYNQDPGTIAVQPDLWSDPLSEHTFTAPLAQPVGGGLYEFTVDLPAPVAFEAGQRYFLSVTGRTPMPWPNWSWAQGTGVEGTFWWIRGNHMYYHLGDCRAFELIADVPCVGDMDGSGAVGFADLSELLAAWGPCTGCAADLDGSGGVGFSDLNLLLSTWGACP